MNPELLAFPFSLVGGRPRPRRLFTDPFCSPIPSWGDVPEADSEAVPMAPLRRRHSCFFDDGPRSGIREGELANMRRKYAIHPSVGMRSLTEFERALDGGAREIAIYEAYLEAGFLFLLFLSFSTYSPYLEDFNGYPSTRGTSWIFRRDTRDSILVLLCPSGE